MNNYENLLNTILDNRYKLIGIRGIGGMAVVYEAEDLVAHRKVAIKMLKDDTKEDAETVKRFINESKAVAMLSHPNIVHIFDVSVKENEKSQYIVMELIDGINLKDYITKKGRLSWKASIAYAGKILNALNQAHNRGIIHRDIKPQNAMLLKNGNLKIIDFGITKLQNSEPLTMTDKAIGTVHYISPEQASGSENITNISDIYSVGVVLFEMTTGELPFVGKTAIQVAMMQINDTPKDPRFINPEIPKGLAQIILKAMRKDPKDRYQSAAEMMKQLKIVYANPAAVFNNGHNGNSAKSSNLPVAVANGAQKNPRHLETFSGNKKNSAVEIAKTEKDKTDEEQMTQKGRTSKKSAPKRKNSKSMLPLILGAVLAFFIVLLWSAIQLMGGYLDLINGEDPDENTIVISDYTKKIFDDDLVAEMAKLRLSVGKVTYVSNDKFEKGEIIAHKPTAKERKKYANEKATIPIDFTVSTGKDTYLVEDLTIMECRNVKFMLEGKKLLVKIEFEPHGTVPSGYIIYTEPGFGTLMEAGDTIILHASEGSNVKMTKMPYVVGRSEKDARTILLKEEIIVDKVVSDYSDDYPHGTIMRQSIESSREVPKRSTKVTLTISLGPRYPKPEVPPPDDTPPEAVEGPEEVEEP
ncbi:MAG: Stk1 family PASTA domain-containing Ser/Thr kinase [Oscillospiraceae bacterium]|nr:Stk1 family PASTA domain-containing Ser/Thr kinase [Oscillospiraceae bacterium]